MQAGSWQAGRQVRQAGDGRSGRKAKQTIANVVDENKDGGLSYAMPCDPSTPFFDCCSRPFVANQLVRLESPC